MDGQGRWRGARGAGHLHGCPCGCRMQVLCHRFASRAGAAPSEGLSEHGEFVIVPNMLLHGFNIESTAHWHKIARSVHLMTLSREHAQSTSNLSNGGMITFLKKKLEEEEAA